MDERLERPPLGWWIAIVGGMALLGVLAFDGDAYAWWHAQITGVMSQALLRGVFVAAVLTHVGEAVYALRLARRHGIADAAGWCMQTFILGFPSLGRLRQRVRERA